MCYQPLALYDFPQTDMSQVARLYSQVGKAQVWKTQ